MADGTSSDPQDNVSRDLELGDLVRLLEEGREEEVVNYLHSPDASTKWKNYFWELELKECATIAITNKNQSVLKAVIDTGVDLNTWEYDHGDEFLSDETLIHASFRSGDPNIVDIALTYQEDVRPAIENSLNIGLLIAAFEGKNRDLVGRAWEMLQAIFTRNDPHPIRELVSHRFHKTYSTDHLTDLIAKVLGFLIDKGFDIEFTKAEDHFTPLLIAADSGHTASVRALIRHGANMFIEDKDRNVLLNAVKNGHAGVVESLAEHTPRDAWPDADVLSALQAAIPGLHAYADPRSDFDVYPELERIIRCCFDNGIDLNTPFSDGRTLLMNLDLYSLSRLCECLLQCGAPVNVVAEDGYSVLWNIASRRIPYVHEVMYLWGNDANDYDDDELCERSRVFERYKSIAMASLLSHNIDMRISKHQHGGKTPLQVALEQEDYTTCEVLLAADCSVYQVSETISNLPEKKSDRMRRLRSRILALCDGPYSLQAQARLAVLGAIGQCDLKKTLRRMYESELLHKPLVHYLGKAIKFNMDCPESAS